MYHISYLLVDFLILPHHTKNPVTGKLAIIRLPKKAIILPDKPSIPPV